MPDVLLRSREVLTSMQEGREFGGVMLVGNERVGLEHNLEPIISVTSLVPEFHEMFEMAVDLTVVPGN